MIVFYDENIKIKLCDEPLNIMKKYIQHNKNYCEAGGVIAGRENLNNENRILEYVTEPMKKDIRTPNRFYRQDNGHIKYFDSLHSMNDKIYVYYGEWHTHFEEIPKYSIIDLKNWKKISGDTPNKVQYHIIVGTKKIVIWKMERGKMLPEKLGVVEWDEINSK